MKLEFSEKTKTIFKKKQKQIAKNLLSNHGVCGFHFSVWKTIDYVGTVQNITAAKSPNKKSKQKYIEAEKNCLMSLKVEAN